MFQNRPAIIEMAEERDRKACIALDQKVDGANRELAQWLIDHPSYSSREVAGWLDCDKSRINRLREWANKGFDERGYRSNGATGRRGALETNDNLEDDAFESGDDVEEPAQVLANVLDSINSAKSVAEAYRKILKVSSFDREAKKQIYDAITKLIVKWRTVQSTLERKGQTNGQDN